MSREEELGRYQPILRRQGLAYLHIAMSLAGFSTLHSSPIPGFGRRGEAGRTVSSREMESRMPTQGAAGEREHPFGCQ